MGWTPIHSSFPRPLAGTEESVPGSLWLRMRPWMLLEVQDPGTSASGHGEEAWLPLLRGQSGAEQHLEKTTPANHGERVL